MSLRETRGAQRSWRHKGVRFGRRIQRCPGPSPRAANTPANSFRLRLSQRGGAVSNRGTMGPPKKAAPRKPRAPFTCSMSQRELTITSSSVHRINSPRAFSTLRLRACDNPNRGSTTMRIGSSERAESSTLPVVSAEPLSTTRSSHWRPHGTTSRHSAAKVRARDAERLNVHIATVQSNPRPPLHFEPHFSPERAWTSPEEIALLRAGYHKAHLRDVPARLNQQSPWTRLPLPVPPRYCRRYAPLAAMPAGEIRSAPSDRFDHTIRARVRRSPARCLRQGPWLPHQGSRAAADAEAPAQSISAVVGHRKAGSRARPPPCRVVPVARPRTPRLPRPVTPK